MADIFVSYRRDLSQWSAGRMNDRLETAFEASRVFFDTVTIRPGENFVEVLGNKVGGCRTLIAVIAPGWLESIEARKDDSNDFVRIEIAQALKRKVRIVPVLIDGAKPPSEARLPDDLKALSQLHAVQVRADTFGQDMGVLIEFLKEFLDGAVAAAPVAAVASVPAGKVVPARVPLLSTLFSSTAPEKPVVPPPVQARVPTVQEVIAARGKWVEEFKVDVKAVNPPPIFFHYYMFSQRISTYGNYNLPGNVFSGSGWDATTPLRSPFWKMHHGYVPGANRKTIEFCVYVDFLTYLGPKWLPEYAQLSDDVFKALGGKPLEHRIIHP